MNGLYPLAHYPTTFDFAAWAVIAKTSGCDHVRFVVDGGIATYKYPKHLAWKRFGNILVPICGLAGLDFSVGDSIEGEEFPYLFGDVERVFRVLGKIEKLKPIYPTTKKNYVTVTLRESFRNVYRNSNRHAWDKFIKHLRANGKEVIVFPECEHAPLDVEYRMALYAGADMNFGISGGPMALCNLSDAPYIVLNIAPKRPPGEKGYDCETLLRKSGFPIGGQFGFRTNQQTLVWKPDTFENILEAYEGVLKDAA